MRGLAHAVFVTSCLFRRPQAWIAYGCGHMGAHGASTIALIALFPHPVQQLMMTILLLALVLWVLFVAYWPVGALLDGLATVAP
mmetsp:Transcript_148793/g.370748  ORF Transcript_148793/g.370748 Transcript_148793/m.370748 type:complete len:84 (-) Transcript_148793:337-588(-)